MTARDTDAAAGPKRPAFDRVLDAFPIFALAVFMVAFYCVEAWTRHSPWLFSDEIEWTDISRAIAATGHGARRTEPTSFKSLYAFLIAPAWWIHSTHTAYAAIKYINAIVMVATAVPTYLLARMMVARRTAAVAALAAVSIPGMSYATFIVPEPLAYFWFTLGAWLIVRALTTRRFTHVLAAAIVAAVAVFVRPEIAALIPVFLVAAAGLWVTGPRGSALRKNWSRFDHLGAIVLGIGVWFLFNRIVLQHSHEWHVASVTYKWRMVDLGFRAGTGLTVGLGLLPVIGGLVSLRLVERRGQPAYRAFAAVLASSIIFISLYTATKAAFLSTVFATLTEERNLIYLSPLLLIGTALVFEAKRVDWRLVAVGSVLVLVMVLYKPLVSSVPYYEAPGFGILSLAHDHFNWDDTALRIALAGTYVVGLLLLLGRHLRGVKTITVALLLAWLLAGEIADTRANNDTATAFLASYLHYPADDSGFSRPLDWLDQITHGQGVTYLGVGVKDGNEVSLTEFWNRSLHHVASLDDSAPPPGPRIGPGLTSPDGSLSHWTGDPYVVTDHGLRLQGTHVGPDIDLWLYRLTSPWKLLYTTQYVYSDGWSEPRSAWTYFATKGPGVLKITLGRTGYKGDAPPGQATISIGTVRTDADGNADIAHLTTQLHRVIPNGGQVKIRVRLTHTPVRVVLLVTGFVPSPQDPRTLGAQPTYEYVPDR